MVGEEVRTANIIADDGEGVKCLVIDRESFSQMIANLEDIKKRYIDLPERKKLCVALTNLIYRDLHSDYSSIHEEFKGLKLSDLRIIATLGVGGFGR